MNLRPTRPVNKELQNNTHREECCDVIFYSQCQHLFFLKPNELKVAGSSFKSSTVSAKGATLEKLEAPGVKAEKKDKTQRWSVSLVCVPWRHGYVGTAHTLNQSLVNDVTDWVVCTDGVYGSNRIRVTVLLRLTVKPEGPAVKHLILERRFGATQHPLRKLQRAGVYIF